MLNKGLQNGGTMKLLITGGSGQLGTEIIRQISGGVSTLGAVPQSLIGAEILAPPRNELDICDEMSVRQYISDNKPDAVIHCAAMSDVEGCEDTPELCGRVNGTAVSYVASSCEDAGAKLILLSSDYVFSGDSQTPYLTDDLCAPLSVYGKSKRLGEINALTFCTRAFIIRTAWLYGVHGKNFVKTIVRKAAAEKEIMVVSDQIGCPTNAEELAYHILKLTATELYGTYHCTGKGICSWYDFAKEIVRLSGSECTVLPCASSDYPQKAQRPHYSVLDNSKLDRAVGNEMRYWKDALKDYMERTEELL